MPHTPHHRDVLITMLARSLGKETAARVVNETALTLGLGVLISRDEALGVLERIALQPGIIGTTARFAKSRVHLAWGQD